MRIFLDTNIVIDFAGHREPFYEDTTILFSLIERGELEAYVATISIPTIAYIIGRKMKFDELSETFRKLLTMLKIAVVHEDEIAKAVSSDSLFDDIEDGIQHYTATYYNCDAIITRNIKDFTESDIPVYSTSEFLDRYLAE